MDANNSKPEIETEDYENIDPYAELPELADAVKAAETGVFEHTVLELWERHIEELLRINEAPMELMFADSVLRQWPWLGYADLEPYREARQEKLLDILKALRFAYTKSSELLFQENENDWDLHKEIYLEVLVQWSILPLKWDKQWSTATDMQIKALLHAVNADAAVLVGGPESLPEYLRSLKDFGINEIDSEWLSERQSELTETSDE